MPFSDLLTDPYQVEFYRNETDRILLGPGTPYMMLELQGLDIPLVRYTDFDLPADDGSFFPVQDSLDTRKVNGKFLIEANLGAASAMAIDNLVRVVRPANFLMYCSFLIPGREKLYVAGRPRRLNYDKERLELSGVTPADFQFVAADPTIYSVDQQSIGITLDVGENSESLVVFHNGTYLSPPTFSIVGPATDPRLTNVTFNNRQIKVDVVLGAGDTLAIDVLNRTVRLNGVSRYDLVRSDNQWWEVLPGQQTITYSRTGTTGSSPMTMTYRKAFVAV